MSDDLLPPDSDYFRSMRSDAGVVLLDPLQHLLARILQQADEGALGLSTGTIRFRK